MSRKPRWKQDKAFVARYENYIEWEKENQALFQKGLELAKKLNSEHHIAYWQKRLDDSNQKIEEYMEKIKEAKGQ
jgi:hypothetical protein